MPDKITLWAQVTCRFTAFHHWPDAPSMVDYLRQPHRHQFHVRLRVKQEHDNRDLEYHILQKLLREQIHDLFPEPDLGTLSCEQIGILLLNRMQEALKRPTEMQVEISEDGENGAIVDYREGVSVG